MKQMTGKERILAAMRREPVDYLPCAPFMNPQDWSQRVGKRWQYPFGPSVPETLEYMVNQLGVDQALCVAWKHFPSSGVSSKVWMEKDIIYKTWDTPAGELHAAIHYDEHWPHGLDIPFVSDYNPAHYVKPWLASMADVECLRHILLPPYAKQHLEQVRFAWHDQKALADKYRQPVGLYFGRGLTGALNMFGPTALCELMITDPGIVDAYLEIDHQLTLKTYEIAIDLGVDFIRRNGFYESCDFYSPAMLEHFLAQRLKKEIQLVHDAGLPIGYTLLTGIMPMLEYLKKLDFDCIVCPDVFFKDADAVVIRDALGGKTSFWTGPSDTIHMPWDKPEAVRAAVRHVFEVFGKKGLIITPCSSSKAVFPWQNVLAMIDEWKKIRD